MRQALLGRLHELVLVGYGEDGEERKVGGASEYYGSLSQLLHHMVIHGLRISNIHVPLCKSIFMTEVLCDDSEIFYFCTFSAQLVPQFGAPASLAIPYTVTVVALTWCNF
jgi:hypothetical protein